ncbi:MAG TPA: transposase [Candidatus Omnitrophota bacterium]|nr:transposase [Candidatus Omnitrophota bacterium]
MPNKYNHHSREFKLEAVKMSQQSGRTVAEVARELGIRENDLHAWRKMVKEQGDQAFPGRGRKAQDELSQLKREVAKLREENAILKKAAIFFAKETENTNS